tara:strand:+ start:1448 stop:2035 length:588 start_codon:yes stop_codon:yes gene_type:complete
MTNSFTKLITDVDKDGKPIYKKFNNSLELEIQTYIDENQITIYHDEAIELFFEIRNDLIENLDFDNSLTDETKMNFISGIEKQFIIPAKKQIIEDQIASKYSEFIPVTDLHPFLSSFESFIYEIQAKSKNSEYDTTDALWAIADDMRARKEDGEFDTYMDAYRWAEKNFSKKGVNITAKKLERAFHKARSEGKVV